jgi:CHAT domain-containing protein
MRPTTRFRFSASLVILALWGSTFGQAPFANKKEEKFFQKLEKYYAKYDYENILKNEAEIRSTFFTRRDTLAARLHTFLAEAYDYGKGDMKTALDLYKNEFKLRMEVTGDVGIEQNDLLYNIAQLSVELGIYKDAEPMLLRMSDNIRKSKGTNNEDFREAEIRLLKYYVLANEPVKGLERTKELKKYLKKYPVEEAYRLKAEGEFFTKIGQASKAEKSLKEALQLLSNQGMKESEHYVATLNSLALQYRLSGQLAASEELYTKAFDILDKLSGDMQATRSALKNEVAILYYNLGNYEQAEKIYLELLESDLKKYGEASSNYGRTAYNLAKNQLSAGKYKDASRYLQLALDVYEKSMEESNYDRVFPLIAFNTLYTLTGDLEKAMEIGKKALAEYERILGKDHYFYSLPLFGLGNTYMAMDDQQNSLLVHREALRLKARTVGKQHPEYARSTQQMAILHWKRNEMKEALAMFSETFSNYYQQINSYFPILNEEEKSRFYYNKLKPAFEQFNSYVVKAAPDNRALQGEMYNYQLATKGIILSASNKVKNTILNSGDSVLIDKYMNWLGQKEQLAQLFSDTKLDESKRTVQIDSLMKITDVIEKELSRSSSKFASVFSSPQPTWQQVRDRLKPGEAAIEMVRFRDFAPDSAGVFTGEIFYAALIVRHDTKDYPEMVLMRNGKLMETRNLANYRNAIRYRVEENQSYTLFWRPIANRLQGIKKVYFSPDGVYNQINVNALRNPETNKYILDEIDLQVVTNTKDLLNPTSSGKKGASVFFGYPNYNLGEAEKLGGQSAGSDGRGGSREMAGERGANFATNERGLRGNMLRYLRSDVGMAMLPGTKVEVEKIDSLYKLRNQNPVVYMNNDAVEEQIKKLVDPQVLHIATHGFFLPDTGEKKGDTDGYVENPLLRSGLILAGANSFIRTGRMSEDGSYKDDGVLTAYEVMNMTLDNTEIVVLSACETGLGDVKNGEGVYGLQRAFRVAGANAVIMSMWTVDDAATQELMTNFYEEWLKTGNKQAAFLTAQKRLKAKWKLPYYWGAFVMVGN